MLYYDADPRDGGAVGSICNACCCQPLALKPGETNKVLINYAAWSLPVGWVVPTPEFAIEVDDSTCTTPVIDNSNYSHDMPINSTLLINLDEHASPVGGVYDYTAPLPLSGPRNGTLNKMEGKGAYSYSPRNGFQGYDYFDYLMEDDSGHQVQYTVQIHVGQGGKRDFKRMSAVPYVDPASVVVDSQNQMLSFAIYMPTSCRPCLRYRLNVLQPATDCSGYRYDHLSCFDIRCKDC